MPSPFPGMDPYIEGWIRGDFHASMTTEIRNQLNPILPKRYDGDAYLYKRDEYIGGGINLLEIDLLRKRHRPPLGEPTPPDADYCIAVHRGGTPGEFHSWPFSVREAIPSVFVPLDAETVNVELDLRKCMDRVYHLGRYAEQLDYRKPPESPLGKTDAKWARDILAAGRTS